jgi:hypothetical protein
VDLDNTTQDSEHEPSYDLTLPVITGSMMPYLHPGGRVYIKFLRAERCRAGDIILYRDSNRLIAHRALMRFRLFVWHYLYQKGDVGGPGGWIQAKQILGVIVKSVDPEDKLLYVRNEGPRRARTRVVRHIASDVRMRLSSFLRPIVRSIRRTAGKHGSRS